LARVRDLFLRAKYLFVAANLVASKK
jgi:hypothetical protein